MALGCSPVDTFLRSGSKPETTTGIDSGEIKSVKTGLTVVSSAVSTHRIVFDWNADHDPVDNKVEHLPLNRRLVSLCSPGCTGSRICGVARLGTVRSACLRGVPGTGCISKSVLTLVPRQRPGRQLPPTMSLRSWTTRALSLQWTSYPTRLQHRYNTFLRIYSRALPGVNGQRTNIRFQSVLLT